MKIISGPASKGLAEAVSASTSFQNVPVISKIFPDGESYVRLDGSVQGEEVAIVQTTCPPVRVAARVPQAALISRPPA